MQRGPSVLIVQTVEQDAALHWAINNRRIAIGWGKIGELSAYSSPDEINAAINQHYPNDDNKWHFGHSLYDFRYRMDVLLL